MNIHIDPRVEQAARLLAEVLYPQGTIEEVQWHYSDQSKQLTIWVRLAVNPNLEIVNLTIIA